MSLEPDLPVPDGVLASLRKLYTKNDMHSATCMFAQRPLRKYINNETTAKQCTSTAPSTAEAETAYCGTMEFAQSDKFCVATDYSLLSA